MTRIVEGPNPTNFAAQKMNIEKSLSETAYLYKTHLSGGILKSERSRFETISLPPTFIGAMERILTADAQGNIDREEFQHAIVIYLLNQIDPPSSALYNEIFNELLGMGDPPRSATAALKESIEQLVATGTLSEENGRTVLTISSDLTKDEGEQYSLLPIEEAITQAGEALSFFNLPTAYK